MRTSTLIVLSLLIFSRTGVCQRQGPPETDRAAETEAVVALGRDQFDKARAGVEVAIANASKAGTLKASTAAYFRDVLARFKAGDAGLPRLRGVYYPPRFDTSPEMEPINLAWDNLRVVMTDLEQDVTEQREKVLQSLIEAIEKAAREAERSADLEPARKLLAVFQGLPDLTRSEEFSGQVSRWLERVVSTMTAALEAVARRDYDAMALALRTGTSVGAGVPVRINFEPVWSVFRARVAAPPITDVQSAQRAVEQALQAKKPVSECERMIAEFDGRMRELERLSRDPMTRFTTGYPQGDFRDRLATAYRGVLKYLADGVKADSRIPFQPVADGPFAMNAEFIVFLNQLRSERDTAERLARERAEAEQRKKTEAAEQQRAEEQEARQAKAAGEYRERLNAARDTIRKLVTEARSPKDLFALSDRLPQLIPSDGEGRYQTQSENWPSLQAELRQTAAWWVDPTSNVDPGRAGFDRSGSTVFAPELRSLRDGILRQWLGERFSAPEIARPPLSELPPRTAAEHLAVQACKKGEWMRAFEILRAVVVPSRQELDPSAASERMAAIRSYLAGRNFEQAGQYREAVLAYRQVLGQIGDHLPIKQAGERLQVLQKEHPEAFIEPPKSP